MIFMPRADEQEVIERIHSLHGGEYILIRMTSTMIDKNNIDANTVFRDMLKKAGIVDYETLSNGSGNGVSTDAVFIEHNMVKSIRMKFYRVNNERGDRRFSIETIKNKMKNKEINEGDLLYISIYQDAAGEVKLFIINLTNNIPDDKQIFDTIGKDLISQKLDEILPKLNEILNMGWVNNSKGKGKKAPKDVGDTFEDLLSISANNSTKADIDGLIEIKTKGEVRTLDTLFTLRPCFDGTSIAMIEKNDRSRVSAFARFYGYESEKHPNAMSLYITIGVKEAPQNNQGFYLLVDDLNSVVELIGINPKSGKEEVTAYWRFEDLKQQLEEKHPSTIWISADEREKDGIVQFKYTEVEFTRAPQFMTFLSMIKSGEITYDWRGYTSKTGAYKGKNHGNAWRIRPKAKDRLFGQTKKLLG